MLGAVTGVDTGGGTYEASADFNSGWDVDIATGSTVDAPYVIDLSTVAGGVTGAPITIAFTTSYYPVGGIWAELNGGNVSHDLDIAVAVSDTGSGVLSGATYLGNTSLGISALGWNGVTGGPFHGTTPLVGTWTETITITPIMTSYQFVSLDNTWDLTPSSVPDGGTTLMLLGSALTGLAGLRSKFGSKRG